MILVFDLDDTLYPEITYVRSGFNQVSIFLNNNFGLDKESTYFKMLDLLKKNGRGHIFNSILQIHGIHTQKNLFSGNYTAVNKDTGVTCPDFKKVANAFNLKYSENVNNLGHGGNFRECIKNADGEYIVFMGDDDMFIPGKIDFYCNFIENNLDSGYILRSSRQLLQNGDYEYFKYYSSDKTFPPESKHTLIFSLRVYLCQGLL